jgi:hypothetical protein
MTILAAIIVTLASLAGIVLTAATLPGIWLALLVAVICQWWRGDLYSWWTLGAAAIVGFVAEAFEFAASAVGTAKAGGTRRGAIGSMIGALIGAVLGSPLFFPLGTILGGALGAGLGALVLERHGQKTWGESARIGTGAATGRLLATLVKSALAVVVASILIVGAFL